MQGTYTIEFDETTGTPPLTINASMDDNGKITLLENPGTVEDMVHAYFTADGVYYDTCDVCRLSSITDQNPPGTSCCKDPNCPSRA